MNFEEVLTYDCDVRQARTKFHVLKCATYIEQIIGVYIRCVVSHRFFSTTLIRNAFSAFPIPTFRM